MGDTPSNATTILAVAMMGITGVRVGTVIGAGAIASVDGIGTESSATEILNGG